MKDRICDYCSRQYTPSNYNQRFCCASCKNCYSCSKRLKDSDTRKLLSKSGYYATPEGHNEVLRGSHDITLKEHGITREQWLSDDYKAPRNQVTMLKQYNLDLLDDETLEVLSNLGTLFSDSFLTGEKISLQTKDFQLLIQLKAEFDKRQIQKKQ